MKIAESCRREAKYSQLDGRNPASVQLVEAPDARLLLGRSCRSTTLSTFDVQVVNPAEFGKLAARHNPVEVAEACRKEADRFTGAARLLARPIPQEYDASTVEELASHIRHLMSS